MSDWVRYEDAVRDCAWRRCGKAGADNEADYFTLTLDIERSEQ